MKPIQPFLHYQTEHDGVVLIEIAGVVSTPEHVALLEQGFTTLYDRFQPPIDVVIGMSGFTLRADVARDISQMRSRLLTSRVRHAARYAVPRVLATLIHTTSTLTGLNSYMFPDREQALASVRARRTENAQ
jgi:hypothetical protein